MLNTIYTRHTDTSEPFYSLVIDENLRLADMPLYVLMSEETHRLVFINDGIAGKAIR
ncbi:MAG: hypothetical protein HRU20_00170 [Pseudomonadales bacterium]|nr:hypothetical protein [Pseudomonadales bacterium]